MEHLRAMIAGAEERMADPGCSDQNFAVLGRMRADFLAQLEQIDPSAKPSRPESDVDEFTQRRMQRGAS